MEPDYKAFAKDMMNLCKKHGIQLMADNEGIVVLGPDDAEISSDFPYFNFAFNPLVAELGQKHESTYICLVRKP